MKRALDAVSHHLSSHGQVGPQVRAVGIHHVGLPILAPEHCHLLTSVWIDRGQLSGFPPAAHLVGRLRSGATVLGDVAHIIGAPEHLQGTEEQPVQPARGEEGTSGDDAERSARKRPRVAPHRRPGAH
ncbi:hypothetical protein EYF80_046263 [Liparis tanakae]|uniref:Uncharacterized protein n=1 Tax=Liparis tanakae TaxID=230148 RepID=A0A4Z2FRD6_9TELE|nr:hypothetical protein EYF80_046263 [Liparis tanakae]